MQTLSPLQPMPPDLAAFFSSYETILDTQNILMNAAFLGKDAARVNNSLNLLKTLEGQYLNALTSHPAFTTYFPSQVPAPLKQAATDEPMKVSVASDKSQKAGATKKVPSTNNSAANSVAAIKRTRGRPKKIQLAT